MAVDLGRVDLGREGIWSRELRYNPDRGARAAAAAELEDLGYGAIFIPDAGPDAGGDVLDAVEHLLAATRRMALATGVLNIWMNDPADVAVRRASLLARFGPGSCSGSGTATRPWRYVRNLRHLGFTGDDLGGRASDRLVDALVAHGDEDAIAARVRAHHDAGADHVCIYVFGSGAGSGDEALPLDAWRRLAPALTS
jgi:alkanesulfonate monooxygenase SsuD/methylene tetrahydromethanopterin reductase-like flavin-dependent oxidoreductase (luciferase family)